MITRSYAAKLLTPIQLTKAFSCITIEVRDNVEEVILTYRNVSLFRRGDKLRSSEIITAVPTKLSVAASFIVKSTTDKTIWLTGSVGTSGADLNFQSCCLDPRWPVSILKFEIDMEDT